MSLRIISPNTCRGVLLKSQIPTQTQYKLQSHKSKKRLPLQKQPVPKLEHTMKLYLRSVKPFLNEKEYSNTLALVKDFQNGIGKQLQDILIKRSCTEVNWVADWWTDAAYLEQRNPLVINSSPGLILPVIKVTKRYEQLEFAARVLLASWKYKELVDNHGIFQEILFKSGLPLDMTPYKKIFGTCRIPQRNKDVLSFNTTSRHFIVIHNGHLFHLDILGEDEKLLSESQVIDQLKYLVAQSQCTNYKPIGVLTSENRDTWAQAYQLLSSDRTNQALLADVQNCLAVLCLDKCCGYYKALKDDDWRRTLGAHQVLHGGGTICNSSNRWFDKSIQYIVGHDGFTGLLFEHSAEDGQAVAGFAGYLLKYVEKYKDHTQMMSESKSPKMPWYMNFYLSPEVEYMIDTAKLNLDKFIWTLESNCFLYHKYGKSFMKSHKISSDSYLQMAFQLAFYRLYKQPGAQYEAASVRIFERGRTETIRSCSIESVQFCQAMLDNTLTCEQKVIALKKAIASHKRYAVQAAHGLGVDRHLFGLKRAAILNGMDIHPLFTDLGFVKSYPTKISTSRVFLKYGGFVAFGPVRPDGYGLCYNPRDLGMVFSICGFKGADTNVDAYRHALEQSLQDMQYILDHM